MRRPHCEPRRSSIVEGSPIGFAGISQAGWIAPLAAERSDLAKFLVLWSGPVCKVSEEDIFSIYTRTRMVSRAAVCRGAEVTHGKIHLARLSRQRHRCE